MVRERGLVDPVRRDRPRAVVVHDRQLEPQRPLEPDDVGPGIAASVHERAEERAVARNQVLVGTDVRRRGHGGREEREHGDRKRQPGAEGSHTGIHRQFL